MSSCLTKVDEPSLSREKCDWVSLEPNSEKVSAWEVACSIAFCLLVSAPQKLSDSLSDSKRINPSIPAKR